MSSRLPGIIPAALAALVAMSQAQAAEPAIVRCQLNGADMREYFRITADAWEQWEPGARAWIPRGCQQRVQMSDVTSACRVVVTDAQYTWSMAVRPSSGGSVFYAEDEVITIDRLTGAARYSWKPWKNTGLTPYRELDAQSSDGQCAKAVDPATIPPPAPIM